MAQVDKTITPASVGTANVEPFVASLDSADASGGLILKVAAADEILVIEQLWLNTLASETDASFRSESTEVIGPIDTLAGYLYNFKFKNPIKLALGEDLKIYCSAGQMMAMAEGKVQTA